MWKYRIAEHFVSINGEGPRLGELAVFIRFAGCNLNCSYCDTAWANAASPGSRPPTSGTGSADLRDTVSDEVFPEMTAQDILQVIRAAGIPNVTLTGGEPLLQPGIGALLQLLSGEPFLRVEIETNGSVDLTPFLRRPDGDTSDLQEVGTTGRASGTHKSGTIKTASTTQEFGIPKASSGSAGTPAASEKTGNRERSRIFTMDYKLPSSGMTAQMRTENFALLTPEDTVKFVAGSREDLDHALHILKQYHLTDRCRVHFSPVFGKIRPDEIVEFMKTHRIHGAALRLQMHKVIWDPQKRGV